MSKAAEFRSDGCGSIEEFEVVHSSVEAAPPAAWALGRAWAGDLRQLEQLQQNQLQQQGGADTAECRSRLSRRTCGPTQSGGASEFIQNSKLTAVLSEAEHLSAGESEGFSRTTLAGGAAPRRSPEATGWRGGILGGPNPSLVCRLRQLPGVSPRPPPFEDGEVVKPYWRCRVGGSLTEELNDAGPKTLDPTRKKEGQCNG